MSSVGLQEAYPASNGLSDDIYDASIIVTYVGTKIMYIVKVNSIIMGMGIRAEGVKGNRFANN